MSRILIATWHLPNHLNLNVALAKVLRGRSHEVAFYTGASVSALLSREGFRSFPFQQVSEAGVEHATDMLRELRRSPRQLKPYWHQFFVGTIDGQLQDLDRVWAEWPPDALVTCLTMWGAILFIPELRRVPVIALSHVANSLVPGPEGAIPGVAKPRPFRGARKIVAGIMKGVVGRTTESVRQAASALRVKRGLPPLDVPVTEYTARLPLYLMPGAPELDYERKDLPASVHYFGACLWDKPADQPAPAWVAELPKDQPCVVVDEGALYTRDAPMLDLAVQAFAGQSLRAILLPGQGRKPGSLPLQKLAPNVTLHYGVALSDVLPRADVLVSNGNSDAVIAALVKGIPVVVVPAIWDQTELAWAIHQSGAGVRLEPDKTSAEQMRAAVERVRREPAFRENAQRLSAALLKCGGGEKAAELIEQAIRRGVE
jgi:MGT family glycosyltransferase